tara:strand:+ start:210 stop:662 length:453 start_codon:yes stop_codon:yes gene_type:complete
MSYQEGRAVTVEEQVKLARRAESTRPERNAIAGDRLNWVGDKCYYYSGVRYADNTLKTFCQFKTNTDFVEVAIQLFYFKETTDNLLFNMLINGVLVAGSVSREPYRDGNLHSEPITCIIPPNCLVEFQGKNLEGGSDLDVSIVATGKVCK